ncbi:MAG: Ribosomal RNA small subunit methyltransferase D [Hyphomicrobiaceae bacterium hypho_1]
MRIIGGTYRGYSLVSPNDYSVRPTSDKVRGSVFDILENGNTKFNFNGNYVLDLFAGTGALGLEALSRGAKFCSFVENKKSSQILIQKNITKLNIAHATSILKLDATCLGLAKNTAQFNIAFIDAPYGNALSTLALTSAINGGWLDNNAIIVIEEKLDNNVILPAKVTVYDHRFYGKTQIIISRYKTD